MNSLNSLHYFLIVLMVGLGLSYLLLPKQRQRITTIQRYVVLLLVAILILSPFLWLVSAVFKDTDVLMQYAFLPPLSEWSSETLNLKNFYNPEPDSLEPTKPLYTTLFRPAPYHAFRWFCIPTDSPMEIR